ncbi:MAG: class I SAM-dependent methyltransferase, partial [Pseudonocardiaceae bacterium]
MPGSGRVTVKRRRTQRTPSSTGVTRLTGAGCVQVVLLTCGMDTRAFRLDWPPDTRVFEVDFAEVLAFRDTGHPLRPPP